MKRRRGAGLHLWGKLVEVAVTMEEIIIFCPDCRGQFEIDSEDIVEGELIECPLCGAEIEVLSESPIKIRLWSEDNTF